MLPNGTLFVSYMISGAASPRYMFLNVTTNTILDSGLIYDGAFLAGASVTVINSTGGIRYLGHEFNGGTNPPWRLCFYNGSSWTSAVIKVTLNDAGTEDYGAMTIAANDSIYMALGDINTGMAGTGEKVWIYMWNDSSGAPVKKVYLGYADCDGYTAMFNTAFGAMDIEVNSTHIAVAIGDSVGSTAGIMCMQKIHDISLLWPQQVIWPVWQNALWVNGTRIEAWGYSSTTYQLINFTYWDGTTWTEYYNFTISSESKGTFFIPRVVRTPDYEFGETLEGMFFSPGSATVTWDFYWVQIFPNNATPVNLSYPNNMHYDEVISKEIGIYDLNPQNNILVGVIDTNTNLTMEHPSNWNVSGTNDIEEYGLTACYLEIYITDGTSNISKNWTFNSNRMLADFSYSISGKTIMFTDESLGYGPIYLWDFGDGNNSTSQNPTHIYGDYGTYSVTFTVTGEYGAIDNTTVEIGVLTLPEKIDNLTEMMIQVMNVVVVIAVVSVVVIKPFMKIAKGFNKT